MGVEIERKYLVPDDGWRRALPDGEGGTRIRQGYLLRERDRTVRVRRKGDRAYLTLKGSGSLERAEYEYEVPVDDAEELLDTLCEPGDIDKTRYEIPQGDLTWEVDEFHGRHEGLVVAEIELPSADTPVDPPAWVGPEVTDDPRYTNAELSRADGPPPR